MIPSRYALWVKGITGSGKSFMSRLFQCFFGPFLNDSSITSWTSTMNFIQMAGFYFKDSLFLVDDFKKGNIRDKNDFTQKIQTYADGTGRGRLNADSTTKQTRPIRGFMLSTGEDVPEFEASILARTLIVDCKNKEKKVDEGAKCLKYRKYYSGIMGRFIHWFIQKDLKLDIDRLVNVYMDGFHNGIKGEQNDIRIARNLALNFAGFSLFCNFMMDSGIIANEEKKQMLKDAENIFLSLRGRQIQTVKSEQGSNIFLNTLSDLIGTGRVSIHNPNMTRWIGQNQEPIEPKDTKNMVGFDKDKNDPNVYIIPSMAYMEVQKAIQQGGGNLNLSKDAIGKQLIDDGIVTQYDEGRKQKTVKYRKRNYKVWVINKSSLNLNNEDADG